MTAGEWARSTIGRAARGDLDGLRESGYQLYLGGLRRFGRMYNYGTPIYDHDWELMIVLDACRPDLLAAVADEYGFLDRETTLSVASATEEWIAKNFTPAYGVETAETVYVTGNPHSAEGLDENRFRHVEEVWAHSWDEELGTVRAEAVTECAVTAGRTFDADRHLVHYMQPHHPFVPTPALNEGIGFGPDDEFDHVWQKLRRGAVSRERVWEGYVANLRYVLDSVEQLLANFEADDVVVTADHGNCLGEFGVYGHPMYVPLDALKRVPFCRTTATDTGTLSPDRSLTDDETVDGSVADRLANLGYA